MSLRIYQVKNCKLKDLQRLCQYLNGLNNYLGTGKKLPVGRIGLLNWLIDKGYVLEEYRRMY